MEYGAGRLVTFDPFTSTGENYNARYLDLDSASILARTLVGAIEETSLSNRDFPRPVQD